MANGITAIHYLDDLPRNTPATVNRRTGELYISNRIWKTLEPEQKLFILLHEMGHIVLNTKNEEAADNWAFEQYAKMGHSLKQSVYALSKILDDDNPEHLKRAMLQLERAKLFDQKNNKMAKISPERLVDNTLNADRYMAFRNYWGDALFFDGGVMEQNIEEFKKRQKEILNADKERRRKRRENLQKKFAAHKERNRIRRKNHQARIKELKGKLAGIHEQHKAFDERVRRIRRPHQNGNFIKNWQANNPGMSIPRMMPTAGLSGQLNNPELKEV